MIFPVRPGVGPLCKLSLLVLAERFNADGWQRNGSRRVLGLWRNQPKRSSNALEGLNDLEPGFVQVDILPAQAEQLATPKTKAACCARRWRAPSPGSAL